jgi:hypothetical protein
MSIGKRVSQAILVSYLPGESGLASTNVQDAITELAITGGGGGAGVWGYITGTLSSQTDLQTVLNTKLTLVGGYAPVSALASGTPTVSTFLRGDGTWAVPSGGGGGTGNSYFPSGW